jgi:aminoglycoside phosphotransferase (APT) family kinase protein/SAM-dependent methyltransferase
MKKISEELLEKWQAEERQPFTGWDFSYLADRWIDETPPWSYLEMVRELMATTRAVLDLGTGGGEKLLGFKDVFPPRVVATEGYPPNFRLAQERLGPLGIEVESDGSLSEILPFEDAAFDLVIDRHTGFNIAEVARVLAPGGVFLTQQVDGRNISDLSAAFDCEQPWIYFTLDFVLEKIKQTNLVVEVAQEWTGRLVFKDVGAIVYYLKAVPWIVADFSVERNLDHLLALQQRLEQDGQLVFCQRMMVVKASKPAPNVQTVNHFETIAREPDDPRTALTLDQIISMCQRGFGPKVKIDSIRELGGGTFNSTYLIKFKNNSKVILRVAPPQTADTFWDHMALMRREHHLQPFFAPIATLMPRTIMADFTHQVVERDYIFQTFIEGEWWDEIEGELTLEENLALWRQFGRVVRKLHDTTDESFGWPFPGSQFASWSEVVLDRFGRIIQSMVENQLEAADVITISNMARTHSSLLDEIKQPRLLHGDLWSFNVLVSRDEGEPNIVGILDADRAWWGDPMADWTMFLLSIRRDEPEWQQPQTAFWEGYGGVSKSSNATLFREKIYQGMHFGVIVLWYAEKGDTNQVKRAYAELREIAQSLPTLELFPFKQKQVTVT